MPSLQTEAQRSSAAAINAQYCGVRDPVPVSSSPQPSVVSEPGSSSATPSGSPGKVLFLRHPSITQTDEAGTPSLQVTTGTSSSMAVRISLLFLLRRVRLDTSPRCMVVNASV
jgi:hypothetical protein